MLVSSALHLVQAEQEEACRLQISHLHPCLTLSPSHRYVVHAEANALLNKNTATVEGASVYVTMFPCNECAKLLIQAGIREVVYHEVRASSCHPERSCCRMW